MMNYNNFNAFIENKTDYLDTYYINNDVTFVDFMLALNNEFKKFSIEDDSRKNLTSLIINKYLNKKLSVKDRKLAEDKFAYSLTHIGLNGLENNSTIKKILSYYHDELSQNINNNLMEEFELIDAYKRQKRENLKKLKLTLLRIEPNEIQRKLPSSIRSFPEEMLDLRHTDLSGFFKDKRKMDILDTDLVVQIYHLPHQDNINEDQFNSLIEKTKNARIKFAEYKTKTPYLSSLLTLINQDILYSCFYNPLNNGTSIELWKHIKKFTLDDVKIQNIENESETITFLFVITKDNELVLSPFKQGDIHIRHIMLSNGHPILTGGGIEFSKDMTKILSVNNGTGHYKADFESLKLIRDKLISSKYDTNETILIDVVTDKRESLSEINKILATIKDIREDSLTFYDKPISFPN
jgi:hypothetical protein